MSVFAVLSGCNGILDHQVSEDQSNDNSEVKGWREDQHHVLLVIKPTESVSDDTWEHIQNVVRVRYNVVGGYAKERIHDQQTNESRAVTIAMPRGDHERYREGYLENQIFRLRRIVR